MRIAIIKSNIYYPSANVINTLKHAQGFSNLNHSVEVLTFEDRRTDKWKLKVTNYHQFYGLNKEIKFIHFKSRIFLTINSFKFIRAFFLSLFNLFPKLFKKIDPEIKISEYCIKKKFDLVFCRDLMRLSFNNIINGVSTIIDLHGSEILGLEKILKLKDNPNFKGIMTLNNVLKNTFIKQGFPSKKIAVMENGVDMKKFDKITSNKDEIRRILNLSLDKKIILYSGVIGIQRGIETIIDASRFLDDKKFTIYILGSGTKKDLRKMKNHSLKKQTDTIFNFLGLKSYKMIPYYLKAADILLATFSNNVSSKKYMSPVKIIEYMASKTPFIATKIGRITKICDNNECLFINPQDPVDLSEKIKLLISNEELKNKLIKNAYLKAQNNTIEKRCQIIIDLVNK